MTSGMQSSWTMSFLVFSKKKRKLDQVVEETEKLTELRTSVSKLDQVVGKATPSSFFFFKIGPSCGKNPERAQVVSPIYVSLHFFDYFVYQYIF